MSSLPPPVLLILGALLIPLLRGRLRQAYLLALPIASFVLLLGFEHGLSAQVEVFGQTLTFMRVDKLSLIFGYVFHIAAFTGMLYALHVRGSAQHVSAMIYAGTAVGAVFAGDLISFFLMWEGMAVSSVFLILARRQRTTIRSSMNYLMPQLVSGLLLLIGIALRYAETGSFAFDKMTPESGSILSLGLESAGTWLIFLAIGIKCGWPLLHTWITDGYPAATPTGAIFLSAFTTKCAVYALARAFPGTQELIWIGTLMATFPIFYAVIENDLRRVLCYSMINQVGFMVVGVGVGTPLAIDGACAHAFCDIIFKGLLFMSMGAVLFRTGRINGSDLGGLHRTMPFTTTFCCIGAASISAFPLFSAFVSKSLIMIAAAEAGHEVVWMLLLFASAGVFHHAGIKIPFFAFFAHDSGLRPKEAPIHMLLAMGLAAAGCITLGCFPLLLYRLLPYEVPAHAMPYTTAHVIQQLQLLFWSALAFASLILLKLYPPELRSVNLDADWLPRKGTRSFVRFVEGPLMATFERMSAFAHEDVPKALRHFAKSPQGAMQLAYDRFVLGFAGGFRSMRSVDRARAHLRADQARYQRARPGAAWSIGTTVLYAAIAFLIFLLLYLSR